MAAMIWVLIAFAGIAMFVFSFLPQLLLLRREERRLDAEIDELLRIRRERRARLRAMHQRIRERVEKQ